MKNNCLNNAITNLHLQDLLKEKGLDVKVAVGGAPVNKEFADSIGADGYSEDATGAVALCKGFVGA